MFFVYILFSPKLKKHYTGQTSDVEKRLARHNAGKVISTKNGCPWEIIWETELPNQDEAVRLEKKIKKRGAKRYLIDIGF